MRVGNDALLENENMPNNTLNAGRRIRALDTGALKREHQRRVAAWYQTQTNEAAKLNTFVSRLVVNELDKRGELSR
jgi:hypothetical protein